MNVRNVKLTPGEKILWQYDTRLTEACMKPGGFEASLVYPGSLIFTNKRIHIYFEKGVFSKTWELKKQISYENLVENRIIKKPLQNFVVLIDNKNFDMAVLGGGARCIAICNKQNLDGFKLKLDTYIEKIKTKESGPIQQQNRMLNNCPFCGGKFNFSQPVKFCPYCNQQLV